MEDINIGQKIRTLRKQQKLTLTALAHKTDFSISYLSQVERSILNPSLSSLKKISEALNSSVVEIMFDNGIEQPNGVTVTRKNQRKTIIFPGSDIRYELITPNLRGQFSVLWLTAHPGSQSGEMPIRHQGEDCIKVNRGKLVIVVNSESYELNEGDSIYFCSDFPHCWYNPFEEDATVTWISCPPYF